MRLHFSVMVILVTALFVSSPLNSQSRQSGYADIEGRKVYYEEKGKGNAILLVHGFSLDTRMWDPQFDVFARQSASFVLT